MLVHRVEVLSTDRIKLHLKCPNADCHTFTMCKRDPDEHGVVLLGYPQITGDTTAASPYGY